MKFCIDCGHNHFFQETNSEWVCIRIQAKECKCAKLIPRSYKKQFA